MARMQINRSSFLVFIIFTTCLLAGLPGLAAGANSRPICRDLLRAERNWMLTTSWQSDPIYSSGLSINDKKRVDELIPYLGKRVLIERKGRYSPIWVQLTDFNRTINDEVVVTFNVNGSELVRSLSSFRFNKEWTDEHGPKVFQYYGAEHAPVRDRKALEVSPLFRSLEELDRRRAADLADFLGKKILFRTKTDLTEREGTLLSLDREDGLPIWLLAVDDSHFLLPMLKIVPLRGLQIVNRNEITTFVPAPAEFIFDRKEGFSVLHFKHLNYNESDPTSKVARTRFLSILAEENKNRLKNETPLLSRSLEVLRSNSKSDGGRTAVLIKVKFQDRDKAAQFKYKTIGQQIKPEEEVFEYFEFWGSNLVPVTGSAYLNPGRQVYRFAIDGSVSTESISEFFISRLPMENQTLFRSMSNEENQLWTFGLSTGLLNGNPTWHGFSQPVLHFSVGSSAENASRSREALIQLQMSKKELLTLAQQNKIIVGMFSNYFEIAFDKSTWNFLEERFKGR